MRRAASGFAKLTSHTANAVHDIVDHLLANGVVTTSIVVGSIFLAADQQLGVEELAVTTSSDLINGRGVEIDKDGARNMLSAARLGEEGLEGASLTDIASIGVGTTIGAEPVLEEVAIQDIGQLRGRGSNDGDGSGDGGRTAPKQSYRAGYQPGPGGGEESGSRSISISIASFVFGGRVGGL